MNDAPLTRPDLMAEVAAILSNLGMNDLAVEVQEAGWFTKDSAAALAAERARADQAEAITDAKVEQAARAMFEADGILEGDWTWADVVREEPSRAEIWRDDARQVLAAALFPAPTAEQ